MQPVQQWQFDGQRRRAHANVPMQDSQYRVQQLPQQYAWVDAQNAKKLVNNNMLQPIQNQLHNQPHNQAYMQMPNAMGPGGQYYAAAHLPAQAMGPGPNNRHYAAAQRSPYAAYATGPMQQHPVPQQPQIYYNRSHFPPFNIYGIYGGVFESAEMSSDMFDEDDSNEILQHDQIKQNVSKENCYLVESTAL